MSDLRQRGFVTWVVRVNRFVALFVIALSAVVASVAQSSPDYRLRLGWPTANHAYANGEGLEAFIQPTVSGEVESGLFGCVRTGGNQFHEALDLMPISRDRRGEATDEVYAVLGGVVRHVNPRAGASSYGRYVVIEHVGTAPSIYTLYAHLAEVDPAIQVGAGVTTSQVIGIMGRSAGGYTIPKDRAHVHFEMGLRLTDGFQRWYDWKKFGSKNQHGVWNGMNLVGFDPLAFYNAFRAQQVDTFDDYLRGLKPAVKVRVAARRTPDFVERYPSLRVGPTPPGTPAGWEVSFDRFGLPFAWRQLRAEDLKGFKRDEVRVTWTDEDELKVCRCKDLVRTRRGQPVPDRDLQTSLQLLFGLRR